MTAARFASGFQKSFTDLPGLGGKSKDRLPYDELMVEAAAYCHYLLSREFPSTRDDDFDEDSGWDDPELDSTWDVDGSDACATALFYSQALLAEHLPAGYTSDFLERRFLLSTYRPATRPIFSSAVGSTTTGRSFHVKSEMSLNSFPRKSCRSSAKGCRAQWVGKVLSSRQRSTSRSSTKHTSQRCGR